MATTYISGQVTVVVNLNQLVAKTGRGAADGLRKAGAELLRQSQMLVPVEFGNLRASGYVNSSGAGFSTVVEVGYTASYALYVHEQVAMKLQGIARRPSPPRIGKHWDPQGRAQAKFLEDPARQMHQQIINIVRQQATITP